MMININEWCGKNDVRDYLNQPFNLSGKTVATNGHVLIAVDQRQEYKPLEKELDAEKFIAVSGEYIDLDGSIACPEPKA
jgi:hypothetical protein